MKSYASSHKLGIPLFPSFDNCIFPNISYLPRNILALIKSAAIFIKSEVLAKK
jgi:hypothetical protein